MKQNLDPKQSTYSSPEENSNNEEQNGLALKGEFDDALQRAEKEFRVYPARHWMSTLYIMASLAISLQQNTFAPQATYLVTIYKVPSIMVSMTSLIHMILHAPVK